MQAAGALAVLAWSPAPAATPCPVRLWPMSWWGCCAIMGVCGGSQGWGTDPRVLGWSGVRDGACEAAGGAAGSAAALWGCRAWAGPAGELQGPHGMEWGQGAGPLSMRNHGQSPWGRVGTELVMAGAVGTGVAGASARQAEGLLGSGLPRMEQSGSGAGNLPGNRPRGSGESEQEPPGPGEQLGEAALGQLSCVEGVRGVGWSRSCQRPSRAAPHRGH